MKNMAKECFNFITSLVVCSKMKNECCANSIITSLIYNMELIIYYKIKINSTQKNLFILGQNTLSEYLDNSIFPCIVIFLLINYCITKSKYSS